MEQNKEMAHALVEAMSMLAEAKKVIDKLGAENAAIKQSIGVLLPRAVKLLHDNTCEGCKRKIEAAAKVEVERINADPDIPFAIASTDDGDADESRKVAEQIKAINEARAKAKEHGVDTSFIMPTVGNA
jgi:hypothetical protein